MIKHHLLKLNNHWKWLGNSDYGLAALLGLLIVYIFFVYPLLGGEAFSGGAVSISFTLILIAGIVATTHHRAIRLGILILAAIAFLTHWLHVFIGGDLAHMISAGAAILFFSIQIWFLSVRVYSAGKVTVYRIYGAIALFLLIGILWANAFVLIYLINPAAFSFAPGTQAFDPPISEMVYFSFVTLTTIGYGDITAVHPLARSLAILEGLIGQLYPAILLARLVTQYHSHSHQS